MTNIVERLRRMSPQLDPIQCETVLQAADEIERLWSQIGATPEPARSRWRDIKGEDIDWLVLMKGKRSRTAVWRRFQPSETMRKYHPGAHWDGLTLGEICDRGVTHWERHYPGWGELTTRDFKEALRKIAAEPDRWLKGGKAEDAFNPEAAA